MFALLRDSNLLKKKRTLCSLDKNNKINRQEKESITDEVTLMNLPGGYSWEFVVGVCHPTRFSKSWTKKLFFFDTRFQTYPGKIHTRFQTWRR